MAPRKAKQTELPIELPEVFEFNASDDSVLAQILAAPPVPPPSSTGPQESEVSSTSVHGAIVPMMYAAIGVAVVGGAVLDAIDLTGSAARSILGGRS
jgi:hypothetical protein